MRWDKRWASVARLVDGDKILAEACNSEGKWHLFLHDGRKSKDPHFVSAFMAMREAELILKVGSVQ